ncbi:MAG: ComEC family competence protein, partial [Deltaproteobacteria bacterium]|nr:ComEC family competence protein [Deltaproteobacteria bacterium]
MRHWKRSFGPWGPGSGGKRHEAIHRPLIPLLISFMGGILIGHMWLPHLQPLIVPLLILITSVLILSLFTPLFSKLPLFIIIFLFAGILLTLASDRPSELSSLTHEREKVIMEGTVLKPASTTRDRTRFELMAERLFIHGQVRKLGERVLVTVYNHTRDFSTGERIRFPARLRRFENFNNPGRYDYELSMRLRGISCAASVSDGKYVIPMGKGHLALPVAIMESFRKAVRDLFRWNLSAQNYALYRALILGERQGIDPKLREHFNIAGLGHILAVSGLHIGIIAWLAFLVSKRILSFSYYLTLKYDIMALTYLFSIVLGREKETWSTLALAALIVLALNPNALFSISFQLSFIAVTGILWLAPELHKRIPEPFARPGQMNIFHRLYIHITGLIVVTISATVFLLPVTSFYFHRVSIVSIAANLTVVPLMGIWVLPLGLLSAACIHLSPSLATFFLQ